MEPFLAGFALSFSLCLDLGLVNVALLRTALREGALAAFLVGVGSALADLVYFTLALFGATALLSWPPARWGFWLGGTAVLLVLAAKMLREVIRPPLLELDAEGEPARRSARQLVAWGASVTFASPSGILWFAAVGGSVIASYGGQRWLILPFAAGFTAAGLLWAAGVGWLAGALARRLGSRLVRSLALVSALVFLYLAGMVFFRGAREILG